MKRERIRRSRLLYAMEQQFTCSKSVRKKARIRFGFYIVGALLLVLLFFLPFIVGKNNRLDWLSVIYPVIAAYFAYQSYRTFQVLRALHSSFCRIEGENVSGISICDPYKKGIPFRIERNEITAVDDVIVDAVKKEDLSCSQWLRREPFSSPNMHGYPSVTIRTGSDAYTLFGIELTDDMKKTLISG